MATQLGICSSQLWSLPGMVSQQVPCSSKVPSSSPSTLPAVCQSGPCASFPNLVGRLWAVLSLTCCCHLGNRISHPVEMPTLPSTARSPPFFVYSIPSCSLLPAHLTHVLCPHGSGDNIARVFVTLQTLISQGPLDSQGGSKKGAQGSFCAWGLLVGTFDEVCHQICARILPKGLESE